MARSLIGRVSALEVRVQANVTAWLESLSDAELAAVAGDVDPDVGIYMDTLSDCELQALAHGDPDALRQFPAAYQRWRVAQRGAVNK